LEIFASYRGKRSALIPPIEITWKHGGGFRRIGNAADAVNVRRRQQELVRGFGSHRVSFAELALPGVLITEAVENRAHYVDV
jgi:hypothetical protein